MPYKKQNFKDGDVLTASHLEKMEDGIIENFAELEKYYSLADLIPLTDAEILEICKTKGK
jgi:hypothetical protein